MVTGAGGLIGSALLPSLTGAGYRVSRLTRRPHGPGAFPWDPLGGVLDLRQLGRIDGVVHLAGENIAKRWTPARKARIRDSRVRGTRLLSEALAGLDPPPRVLVSASATGIYGDRGSELLTESSPPGDPDTDFLAAVCQAWEAAADPARAAGIRVIHPRLGLVLSAHGGALGKLLPPFRLGLGGPQGNGSQWMSWIAIDDVISAVRHLIENERLEGPVNVTAPEPVVNRDFVRTLGQVLGRPTPFAVPATVLRLALGEMANSTILASARVHPAKLMQAGYRFEFPVLEPAFRHVLGGDPGTSFQA